MKPRFMDMHRYKNGYVSSGKTDIRKTFNRVRAQIEAKKAAERAEQDAIREQQEKDAAEAKVKVAPMRKAK